MAHHTDFGKLAEDLAADYLIAKNYTILARNFFFQKNEIDIVAEYDGLIIVIEVKARGTDIFMEPQEAVTKKKIKAIVLCADHFMQQREIDKEIRFDIISVLPDKSGKLIISHLEDAFQSFDAN